MSRAEKIRKAYPLAPAKKQKYNAKRQGKYPSGLEAQRGGELDLLEKMGKITQLRKHPRYVLLPPAPEIGYKRPLIYEGDFEYVDLERNAVILEDTKGFPTPAYLIKRRLLEQLHGIKITEVRQHGKRR